ncbi:MAG: response regulator [Anaerolineae bacterium]|nr:response regulator [Gloeobacterales cyanobacterium ES-bin-313]
MVSLSENSVRPLDGHPLAAQFDVLSRQRFSGRLDIQATNSSRPWSVFFCLGRIFYTTGGTQGLRRWHRQFSQHCPTLEPAKLKPIISQLVSTSECWEYQLLLLLIEREAITGDQAFAFIRSMIDEVMLDIAQGGKLACRLHRSSILEPSLLVISTEQVLQNLHRSLQLWRATGLQGHGLNMAPVIRKPESLQQRLPELIYRTMATWLDGKRTLRDLAVSMKQNVFSLTRSLSPYIKEGIIELVEVLDLPASAPPKSPPSATSLNKPKAPLVACVDDSPQVCQIMESILKEAGYQFVAFQDPLRAMVSLLQAKPDMIFLDLVMPNTSGYEICSRLRKTAAFQRVPIVILTGNDGIIDRVRAKVVGSSDFMGKPIVAESVLAMAQKHLPTRTPLQTHR